MQTDPMTGELLKTELSARSGKRLEAQVAVAPAWAA